MLRLLILLLLLANATYLAWSQHWLADLGAWAAPARQHEPARAAQQIKPELVTLLDSAPPPAPPTPATPDKAAPTPSLAASTQEPAALEPTAAAAAPAPAAAPATAPSEELATPPAPATQPTPPPAPPEPAAPVVAVATANATTRCMQAGPFDDDQSTVLSATLGRALPKDSWEMETSVQRGRWIVYSGKLADNDALEARKAELKQMKVAFREVNSKELQPGLVLGTFSAEASAQQGLKDVARAGVKGAKVLEVRPDVSSHRLRLPKATEAQLSAAAQAIAKATGASTADNALQPCR